MKNILLICIALISIKADAQYLQNNSTKKISILKIAPVGILGGTFILNDYRINNKIGDKRQTATIAATGMILSVGLHFGIKYCKEHKIISRRYRSKK